MSTKGRNQNPVIGSTIRLKFFTFSGGEFADPHSVDEVNVYKLYSTEDTEENPLGRTLIKTIESSSITKSDVGKYYIDLELDGSTFTQGHYQDEWSLVFEEGDETCKSPMYFQIYPTMWFTDSMPIVHDFSFDFQPNKIVVGSKKYLQVAVKPEVPRGTDKQRYYENMAIAGDLYISIEQKCGDCLPEEQDLRLVVDRELIAERDGCVGYYRLDTSELDCGMYDVWFEANLGPNVFISDKQPLQIYH